jgi:chloramphenicol O-acetyltransferase type A
MKILDMKTWSRLESFNFFKKYDYPQFNITTQIDITKTYQYLEKHDLSKYNAILWMISCAANHVPEIRYRIRKDMVVEHDRIDPSFTVLTDDHTLAFCAAKYTSDVPKFFNRVEQGIADRKANPKMEDEPGVDDLIYVSCVPWISFTSISHPIKINRTDSIPRISWGKFTINKEQISMPVSLQLHHGLADGYHAGLFIKKLEGLLDQPETINWPG